MGVKLNNDYLKVSIIRQSALLQMVLKRSTFALSNTKTFTQNKRIKQ